MHNPHSWPTLRLACISLCCTPCTRHQRCLCTQHYTDSLCEASCQQARTNSPDTPHTVWSHQNIAQLHIHHTPANHCLYYTSRRHKSHSCLSLLLTCVSLHCMPYTRLPHCLHTQQYTHSLREKRCHWARQNSQDTPHTPRPQYPLYTCRHHIPSTVHCRLAWFYQRCIHTAVLNPCFVV